MSLGWSFETSEKNCIYKMAAEETCEPPLFDLHFLTLMEVHSKSTPDDDLSGLRRLNHNAREHARRKKINLLFSSLRSVLPPQHDQRKRLRNPATVSQVLKYMPSLQKQVEELVEQKKQVMSMITTRQEVSWRDKAGSSCHLLDVSTNQLSDLG